MENGECPVVIVGNWKMYKQSADAAQFLAELIPLIKGATALPYLAVPFTLIRPLSAQAKGSSVVVGAQNMHDASEGAFTGEVAASMLKDVGAYFVILGHSERRRLFLEDNAFINRKVKRALAEGLQAILCIGETQQEREEGQTASVLKAQLEECLAEVGEKELSSVMVAYEPIWAVGTNQPATPEMAQEAHRFCRAALVEKWGVAGERVVIQYGGSVKPENAAQFLSEPDINGLLVGGASLSPKDFSQIILSRQ
jgi:triosephosphate isomerase